MALARVRASFETKVWCRDAGLEAVMRLAEVCGLRGIVRELGCG
jgi:hypothetical protein